MSIMIVNTVFAQQDKYEEKVFKDWALRCPENEAECVLEQRVFLKGKDNTPLVHMTIRRFEVQGEAIKPDQLWIVLRVPLGIKLMSGVQITIDKEPPVTVALHHCRSTGCIALFVLDPGLKNKLEAGHQAQVTFTALNGQAIGVPISLSGITAGLKHLENKFKAPQKTVEGK